MSGMEFRMLGPLEVTRQDAPVLLPPGRARTLIALLLVHRRRVVATTVLLDELWRGQPPSTAPHALQVYVSNLRKLLEPDRPTGQPWRVLLTRNPGYVIDVPAESLDAGRFELRAEDGGRALDSGRWADASRLLGDALRLWRGSFLADLADEPFVAAEASRLDEIRAVATERWGDAELALGNHGTLVGRLEALLRLHPFRERLWAQLMFALYRSGRPTDALNAYQRLQILLDEEMGLAPSPELQRLQVAILRHDPDLSVPARAEPVALTPATTGSARAGVALAMPPRLAAKLPIPLTGRERERAVLARSWGLAQSGSVRVVLLAGELGIGKTRLATEAAAALHQQGGLVLYGTCGEGLAVPYQPFVEALAHLVSNCPADELGGAVAQHGGELARLFPELARLVPGLPEPQSADPETQRYLLFTAVAELMARISARRPTLLVLDDLHWATKPTILMLRHVIRSAEPMRLLIVGTYRDTEIGRGHPLSSLLADLWRDSNLERIDLRGLSEDDAMTLVTNAVGKESERMRAALARVIHAQAGGSPLFMGELVRHIVDAGVLSRAEDDSTLHAELSRLGVPDSVRDIILHRLSRLPEPVEQLLVTASVAGRAFDMTWLERLSDGGRPAVLDSLDIACRAALIHEVQSAPGSYVFAHALVRQTLYDRLTAARRMDLHRRAADALEALGRADADPAGLARHWVAGIPATGADPTDAVRAARAAQRAGRLALAASAYEEAISHLEGAVKAARQVDDAGRMCELLVDLGEAQRCAGDARHRDTLLTAGDLAYEIRHADHIARAALANQRGVYSHIGEVDVQRVTALRKALEVVGPGDHHVRAKLLAALATEVHFQGPQRLDLAREALDLARRGGDEETLAQTLAALWFAAWGSSADSEREAVAGELEAVAAGLEDRSLRFQANVCVFLSATGRGDTDRADEALRSCALLAEELGQPVLRWRLASLQTHRAIIAGNFEEATAAANQSLIFGELTGQPDRVAFFVTPKASIRLLQGRPADVEALVSPMIEQFPGVLAFTALLAWGLAEAGRHADAAAIIERLRPDRFARVPRDYGWLFYVSCLSRACHKIGDASMAIDLYDLLQPSRHSMATTQTTWIGPVAHDLGLLAVTLGRHDAAESHFSEAIRIQDGIGARGTAVHTRLEWARALIGQGGSVRGLQARTLLLAARQAARELGMPAIVARIEDLLDQPGTDADRA